jgi:hypothetical protein
MPKSFAFGTTSSKLAIVVSTGRDHSPSCSDGEYLMTLFQWDETFVAFVRMIGAGITLHLIRLSRNTEKIFRLVV